ncbi:MAG: kinase/pyrophosphorylase [Alphaproteobacteria bacterium]|nr:kinase/pyrophosphorylase [Alphaproteobacteria bacterium]
MEQSGLEDERDCFHVHLVSDATGETLIAISRAAAAQYPSRRALEHVHSLVRSQKRLDQVLSEIREAPGIILYTLVDPDLNCSFEEHCSHMGLPFTCVLDPVLSVFRSYLGMEMTPRVGGQHVLDADYFKRIEALNFTMVHDDGHQVQDLDKADVVLIGVSRTSKTPTSIYLANRGIRTANVPFVSGIPLPQELFFLKEALVVGMVANVDHILQIRRSRILSLHADDGTDYVDRRFIAREIVATREICIAYNWPVIDVTRRSIEETAAAVILLYRERCSNALP